MTSALTSAPLPSADAPRFALDLAFTPADASLVKTTAGSAAHQRLCCREVWDSTLQLWLGHLAETGGHSVPKPLLDCEEVCLGLQFVNDEQIAELNQRWRNKASATDVLSFSALEAEMPLEADLSVELGDIIVSVPTAERQALEQNHSMERELCWLVSHGLLHLLGWDHPDDASLMTMLQCQEQLLAMAGMVLSHGEIDCESADEITAGP